LIEALNPKTGD